MKHLLKSDTNKTKSFQVQQDGQRINRLLKEHYPELSNQVINRWIQRQGIHIDGKAVTKGFRPLRGSIIQIVDTTPLEQHYQPSSDKQQRCSVLYEDEHLIALNKPSGVPSHPLHPWENNIVIETVMELCPSIANIGEKRAPGLLHRLDNGTSGVLIFAKKKDTYTFLQKTRQNRQWEKSYLLWVEGKVKDKPFSITTQIGHHPNNKTKMLSLPINSEEQPQKHLHFFRGKGQQVTTKVFPVTQETIKRSLQENKSPKNEQKRLQELLSYATPLCVSIDQGVRHQIRVHLASIGHPIVGDTLYGKQETTEERLLLHSWKYILPHPALSLLSEKTKTRPQKTIELIAPPPFPFPCQMSW